MMLYWDYTASIFSILYTSDYSHMFGWMCSVFLNFLCYPCAVLCFSLNMYSRGSWCPQLKNDGTSPEGSYGGQLASWSRSVHGNIFSSRPHSELEKILCKNYQSLIKNEGVLSSWGLVFDRYVFLGPPVIPPHFLCLEAFGVALKPFT